MYLQKLEKLILMKTRVLLMKRTGENEYTVLHILSIVSIYKIILLRTTHYLQLAYAIWYLNLNNE